MEFSHRGLHWISIDERTVKTAYLKPVWSNGPYTAEGFRRIGTAAYLIMARRLISTKKAGSLTRTFSHPSHTFIQVGTTRPVAKTSLGQNPTF
jgi:hypothetical protein